MCDCVPRAQLATCQGELEDLREHRRQSVETVRDKEEALEQTEEKERRAQAELNVLRFEFCHQLTCNLYLWMFAVLRIKQKMGVINILYLSIPKYRYKLIDLL